MPIEIRGSSAKQLEDVHAVVVLETSGDIHVITGEVDPRLMKGVRGWGASSGDAATTCG